MARLDDLVADIRDQALRRRVESALADLKRKQRFGLVYEEHVPETTALLGLPIAPGAIVQRREDSNGQSEFRVVSVGGRGKVAIEPLTGGQPQSISPKDLLLVKRFGEPIYPAFTSVGSIRRGPSTKPAHAVINGENFHALQLFVYLFEGQADCIYLDPPYNTGARDWKYNNLYVDQNDTWRHSKWLSFMEKRLRLAKRLLKPDGVLIVTIDEHEVFHLGMLLERLFPEYLRHMVTIVINPKGTGKLNFARVDEYAIFCVPNRGDSIISGIPLGENASGEPIATLFPEPSDDDVEQDDDANDEADEDAEGDLPDDAVESNEFPFPLAERDEWELRHARRRGGESSYRHQRKNQFYPIYVDPDEMKVVRAGKSLPLDEDPNFSVVGGLRPIWPIDKEGNHRCWRFIPTKMQSLIDARRVVMGRYNNEQKIWTLNIWERRPESKKLKTVWWETAHDAGTHGTTMLHKILGRRDSFPFPKSVYAVRDALAAVVRNRPNALIVDFFAGSGTTFHATCMLNAQYPGNRRCVLVTNNELAAATAKKLHAEGLYKGDREFEKHGIFEQATRPRCQAVVSGKRPDGKPIEGKHIDGRPFSKGFEENVEFFRIDYLDPDDVDLGTQFNAILPALWLAAGGVGDRETVATRKDFTIPKGSTYGVLFKESKFRQFKNALAKRSDVTHVWLVTDSEEAYAEMRSALPSRFITSMLYRDYLRNFRINTRHSL
ncbi:MAG TPA: site-specific DNA-methyltransferase [Pirellulales bacterium]|nr:site-specific DNA-methyltransferase [Pirellulales bacterium]